MATSSLSDYSDDYDLISCAYCSRTFSADALPRHEDICCRLQRNEKRRKKEIRNKITFEAQQKEKNIFKLTDVIERKTKRRKHWRRDHERFINNLLQQKRLRNKSISKETLNYVKESRYSLDLEEMKRKFHRRALEGQFGDEIQECNNSFMNDDIRNNGNLDHSEITVDVDIRRKSNSRSRSLRHFQSNSLLKTSSVPDLLRNQKNYANSKEPISTYEDSSKFKFLNSLIDGEQKRPNKLTRSASNFLERSDSRKSLKQRTKSDLEIFYKELTNPAKNKHQKHPKRLDDPELDQFNVTHAMKTYQPEMNGETKRYLQQITKVMDYYQKNVWSPTNNQPGRNPDTNASNQAEVTSVKDIPSNLSSHKKRLEYFKLRNKENQNKDYVMKDEKSDLYDIPSRFSNIRLFEEPKSKVTMNKSIDKEPKQSQNDYYTDQDRHFESSQNPIVQEARRIFQNKDDIADRLYDGSKYDRFKEHHLKEMESRMDNNGCHNQNDEATRRNENHQSSNLHNASSLPCIPSAKEMSDNNQSRKISNLQHRILTNEQYAEKANNHPNYHSNEHLNYQDSRSTVKFNIPGEHESNVQNSCNNKPTNPCACNCRITEPYNKKQPEISKSNNPEPHFDNSNRSTAPRNYSSIWKESNDQSRMQPRFSTDSDPKPNGILKNSNYQPPPVAPTPPQPATPAKAQSNNDISKPVSSQPANPDPCGAFGDEAYRRAWTWRAGDN